MALKRKIRLSKLPQEQDSVLPVPPVLTDPARPSAGDDPFVYPNSHSESSSLASDGQKPTKPRLVFKLGSTKKPSLPPDAAPSTSAVPSIPLQSETSALVVPEEAAKKVRGPNKEKRKNKKRRTPKHVDEINVNDLLMHLDDGHDSMLSRSETLLPAAESAFHMHEQMESNMSVPQIQTESESIQPVAPAIPVMIKDPFEQLLDYYLSYLQRKDNREFFGFPITDLIAPNYSLVVKHPMDFSTMRKKLARGWYENLHQFKSDFELICSNAMTYNSSETVYYRAARKLSRIGKKLMSKERLPYAKRVVLGIDSISSEVLSFDVPLPSVKVCQLPQLLKPPSAEDTEQDLMEAVTDDEAGPASQDDESRSWSPSKFSPSKFKTGSLCGPYENIPQENAEEILEQMKKAGREVAERLATRQSRTNIIMPTRSSDGSITLNILNPDNRSNLTIGALAGPLKIGSDHLPAFDLRPKMTATSGELYSVYVLRTAPCGPRKLKTAWYNMDPNPKNLLPCDALLERGFFTLAKDATCMDGIPNVIWISLGLLRHALNWKHYGELFLVFDKYYKDYGSFSTHAPIYDSKGSVFTKEEIGLLRTAYGSERGIAYAESLIRWSQQVKHPAVKKSIEKLLNDASGGEHSDVVYLLNERILARAEEDKAKLRAESETAGPEDMVPLAGSEQAQTSTLDQLKGLADCGIDVSFLDAITPDLLKPLPTPAPDMNPGDLLSLNGELLHQLYLEQTKRLATASTAHLRNISPPADTECILAEEAVKNLAKLLSICKPEEVVSSTGVRKALNLL